MRRLAPVLLAFLFSASTAAAQDIGIITTFAGGGPNNVPALSANLAFPDGVAVDGAGNFYIAVQNQNRIFKVDTSGQLTVVAGVGRFGFSGDGGPATSASLASPAGVAVDSTGNLFIADFANLRIRRVDAATGIITTVVGNGLFGFSGDGGVATNASLRGPTDVAVDSTGNLFITDRDNQRVRRVDAATGTITTVAGNGSSGFSGDDGPATSARLRNPRGVAVDSTGNLFIADRSNQRIRRVDAATGTITTVAGTGAFGFNGDNQPATSARLGNPIGVAVDSTGNLFIADQGNSRIRRVDAATGTITTIVGDGFGGFSGDGGPATSARLRNPSGVAVDSTGNLFIADQNNQRIRRVDAATGTITTVAGNGHVGFSGDDGPATSASLLFPRGVAVDSAGNLFIADQNNLRIRRVDAATGVITTVAGNGLFGFSGDGGPATSASMRPPTDVALDSAGNLFIADQGSQRVRRVDAATGVITTVAGNGSSGFSGDGGPATNARMHFPNGLAVDSSGNLFIVDHNNSRIRRVDAATGVITTVAGNGVAAFSGDGGPATSASLRFPQGVAVDATGDLFIADRNNNRIRRVDAGADGLITGAADEIITTVAGNGNFGFSGDGGAATAASLRSPVAVAVDANGNLFIADRDNTRIRRVDTATGTITTVAGTGLFGFSGDGGPATSASLAFPSGVAVDSTGHLFIADLSNQRIRRVQMPPQAIQELMAVVQSFNLQQGITNSLVAKLDNALAALEAANADQREDAINKIQAFINSVEAQRGKELTKEQADQLIALATSILSVL